MAKLKLTQIGNSVGVILPKELLAKLNVGKGDELIVTDMPDGIMLRAYSPDFAKWMEIGEKVMRENRDALRKLAE
ncbi:MAG: AbrB/MazE/SpoVT family DNA-binding domain-containing protein [Rickettsiales bacterium]